MKKIISILICLCLMVTMFAGITVSAAETLSNNENVTRSTIYEDVADLQDRVAALESQVATLTSGIEGLTAQITALAGSQTQELAADTDLNTLGEGKYFIPTGSVCGSLLNKPTTSNATGFITVDKCGSEGQKIMNYYPCAETASYYQRAYYLGTWTSWKTINLFDSGWVDLTLNTGVNAFNEEQKPRFRRVGNEVFITGAVKNISSHDTIIGTLPAGYRPSKKLIIAVPSTGEKFSRISIATTGVITYEQIIDSTPAASYWHSVACSFNVD